MKRSVSRLYHPNPEKACGACAFGAVEQGGRYEHAPWCESFGARVGRRMVECLMDAAFAAQCEERKPGGHGNEMV